MKGKILFVAGLATGYVLGTRAGRARYEQIVKAARSVWTSPPVHAVAEKAGAFVSAKTPELVEFVAETVRRAAAKKSEAARASKAAAKTAARAGSTGASAAAEAAEPTGSAAGSPADGDTLQGHSTS